MTGFVGADLVQHEARFVIDHDGRIRRSIIGSVNHALRGIFAWRTSLRLIPPSAGNHQSYQQTENSEPMRGAVVTKSNHRHSPQKLVIEGLAAREPQKSLNASTATAQRPPPSQIAFRAHFVRARRPHKFTTPRSGSIAGGWLPNICRVGRSIGSNDWNVWTLGDPELTKYRQLHSLGVIGSVVSELGREAARYRSCRLEPPSRPEILQASLTTIPAGALDGHHSRSLGLNQPREARPDRVGHVIRREMRIMAFRHPGVGVAELPGNDRHGHGLHGEDRRMGMPQHMESDCRDNAGPLADFTHSTQLFGAFPAASVIALEQHVGGGTAADQPIHQLRCLASESVNYFTLGGEKICNPLSASSMGNANARMDNRRRGRDRPDLVVRRGVEVGPRV